MRSHRRIAPEQLTAAMVRDRLRYDEVSGIFYRRSQHAVMSAGTLHRSGYIRINFLGSKYSAHRLAWLYVHGAWPVGELDHIDGVKTNNAIANLREATRTQNQYNRERRGWYFHKRDRKFVCHIRINNKYRPLGRFETAEEARTAYLEAHAKNAGEFSFVRRINGGRIAPHITGGR